jgi:hypothetical protein
MNGKTPNGKNPTKPNGGPPPLKGAALKRAVISGALAPLRKTEERKCTRQETHGALHETIEHILLSEEFRQAFEKARDAFVLEQAPARLAELIAALRKHEPWAWKAFLDATGIGGLLRAVSADGSEPQPEGIPAEAAERAAFATFKALIRRKDDRQHPEPAESHVPEAK